MAWHAVLQMWHWPIIAVPALTCAACGGLDLGPYLCCQLQRVAQTCDVQVRLITAQGLHAGGALQQNAVHLHAQG